ncbi:phosphotransferase family protein [Rossellomorea vietnamensis]|uniref:phosphotransferase family protein n=1 Tax=Rossellomorea vietnamensis TaxID=218284 RepID=UPI00077C191E|nr:phosphotransferase [Rossellomorea vietnamensis]OXS59638.1 aminoglycoside phosphotransferase [Bacillus sp. DSM 27956]PRX76173.1 aminoglycoside 2''-phosphotransferase [Bacillus sp. V-88]SLK23220.1 aminoglycoside 2''-phosphotransferase [Bacillus sp. V-88]
MVSSYEKRIRAVYPDLKITHSEMNEIGQNNDVIIINDSLVFRFPKYTEGIMKLKKETRVLEGIKGNIPLPVPYPIYQSLEPEKVGMVFTGYKLVEGSPLWPGVFIENEEHHEQIASRLVGFLTVLHSQSLESMNIEKKSIGEIRRSIEDLYDRFKEKLFPHMNERAKVKVSQHFDLFLSKNELLDFQPVLTHGDFGASNILWDPERHEVSGIIDFGEAEVGDPAYDFAGLLSSYGEYFVRRCLEIYPNGDRIFGRMNFYRGIFGLQEALHGIENDDPVAFENGMKGYR